MPEQIVETTQSTQANESAALDDFQETMLLMEYCFAVHCSFCDAKVLDPDKAKNQTRVKGRCPSCNLDPDEEKFKLKQAQKRERKQRNKNNNKNRRNKRQ